MKSQHAKSFSNAQKRQILTNALITQFETCLIPIETLSVELFSDSCAASAISYTKALTNESFRAFTFHDSARAPEFVLVNDLAEYLLVPIPE
ncbi:pyocin activator PrtN family protein [Alteromonas macleodii]|uniref:pyocin activator PrtN family protein n=1 Tax=Alteromonas TaxID=226 RepID=UPI00066CF5C3|nr:pyocin activator PrtN family protein [Alteromonas macleodii]CAI3966896.1 Pyocin activator protein PrtN [Alteromonas macleodii]VTP55323.1 Pyocin activator protein PrtN [Alteromonas macleodii]